MLTRHINSIALAIGMEIPVAATAVPVTAQEQKQEMIPAITPVQKSPDLTIKNARVKLVKDWDLLVFEIQVAGVAGKVKPEAKGSMMGAPVLGYVFPTTLKPTDVGFSATEGIVALAITSHPDFDDTALWDENNDKDYANDGAILHAHWVVLNKDGRVKGGLAVKQFSKETEQVTLPPTNPGMPMYMDSRWFSKMTRCEFLFQRNELTTFATLSSTRWLSTCK